jgi:ribosomal protein S18 acetylase RimI-like enzyme
MVREDEVDVVLEFMQEVFPDADIEIGEDDALFIAEENDELLGFAHIIELNDKVILQGLGVEESYRGQGIGSSLLSKILEVYDVTDKPIFLKTKSYNPAIELYERYGFTIKRFGSVHVLVKRQNS